MTATLIAALVIALACVVAAEPRLLGRRWPPYLLSAGAGIGIAYVVVHLLPEIAIGAEIVRRSTEGRLPYAELHAYLLVLIGIIGTLFLRGLQTGFARSYALSMLAGTALFAGAVAQPAPEPIIGPNDPVRGLARRGRPRRGSRSERPVSR